MKTHIEKRIADIKASKLTKGRERKYIAQLTRRGWSDMDCWGLNIHLANYMLPMLKKFFKSPMGYPCNLKSVKEWQLIGDKMIWAIERYAKDDAGELAEVEVGYSVLGKDKSRRKAWLAALTRNHEQMTEGMRLFAEYFGNLWD